MKSRPSWVPMNCMPGYPSAGRRRGPGEAAEVERHLAVGRVGRGQAGDARADGTARPPPRPQAQPCEVPAFSSKALPSTTMSATDWLS
jgi:hypothetical protein